LDIVSVSRISPIQDAVGRLAHRVLQRDLERVGVGTDLPLVDDRALVLEGEFDRVFQREDMPGLLLVAVVDHRSERGRLARSGGADHQQQPALVHHQVAEDRRQVQRGELRDVVRDEPDHAGHRAALAEHVDPEAADVAHAVAEVQLVVLLEDLPVALVDDLAHQGHHVLGGEPLLVHRHHRAVELELHRRAGGKEQVGRLLLRHQLQQALHHHPGLPMSSRCATSPSAQGGSGLNRRAATR